MAWIALACAHDDKPAAPVAAPVVYVPAPAPSAVTEDEPTVVVDSPAERRSSLTSVIEVWEGTGVQSDGQTWSVRVSVHQDRRGRCATVDYPSIPCSGVWLCDEKSTDVRLTGIERITHDAQNCIDGCAFDAEFDTGTLYFDCSEQDLHARARIERVE